MYRLSRAALLFAFALFALFASSAFGQTQEEQDAKNPRCPASDSGQCAPHEPVVIIVDVMGAKLPILIPAGAPIVRGVPSRTAKPGSASVIVPRSFEPADVEEVSRPGDFRVA